MLKGTNSNVFLNITEFKNTSSTTSDHFVNDKDTSSAKAISTPVLQINAIQPSTSLVLENYKDSTALKQTILDSIFASSDRRESAILSQKKDSMIHLPVHHMIRESGTEQLFSDYPQLGTLQSNEIIWNHENIFRTIETKNISNHSFLILSKNIDIPRHLNKNQTITKYIETKNQGFEGKLKMETGFNWLPALLLFSLFVFSFIKIIYRKYIVQVLYSLINYQASVSLLRDRNVLFRNMAVGLNLIFAINGGLFVYYLIDYFKIGQIYHSDFISIIIYAIVLVVLFNLKFIICKILGFVFMVHDIFEEYIHNENLSNKNIGLLLFPIIILIPYIPLEMKPLVLYTGLVVLIVLFVLRIIRGFQIIIRKEVSSFYLILYLCTIEILPILIMVKYSKTMI